MITTIEQLKSLVDNTHNSDVPIISYREWLKCLEDFLMKIENNLQFNYSDRSNGSLLLFVEVSNMTNDEEENYNHYRNLLRKFFGLYGYDTSPKECWDEVVNNPDIVVEPLAYRPLK